MRTPTKTLMCALGSMALLTAAGGALAQMATPMKGDAMDKGAMASGDMKMSKMDMKMMKKCKAMSNAKMMANTKCKAMMDAHPDMMKK